MITYIEDNAFKGNQLTSVTFPSTAQYFNGSIYNSSFDADVIINHQY